MILHVYFARPIIVGSHSLSYWSADGTQQVMRLCTVEDKGPAGVILRFKSGDMYHEIDVPRSNIDQITRSTPPEKKK